MGDEKIIKQDGKTYRQDWKGDWKPDTDWKGDPKVETDWKGDPKIETDWKGDQKIETDWKGDPIIPPDKPSDCSGGSGCFITTACIASKGLPDNCEELTLLRAFRDSYVANLPTSEVILNEYYKIAPAIVKKIDLLPNKETVYNQLYATIQTACQLIKNESYDEAFSLYSTTVKKLKDQFFN